MATADFAAETHVVLVDEFRSLENIRSFIPTPNSRVIQPDRKRKLGLSIRNTPVRKSTLPMRWEPLRQSSEEEHNSGRRLEGFALGKGFRILSIAKSVKDTRR